jgi:hypothetical protein
MSAAEDAALAFVLLGLYLIERAAADARACVERWLVLPIAIA